MEDDVRVAIDSFNRFRRPNVEAKLLELENNTAIIEFLGGREQIDYYINYFKEKLESTTNSAVRIEAVEKDGSCKVKFATNKAEKEEEDPIQKALRILGKYAEGAPPQKFGFED